MGGVLEILWRHDSVRRRARAGWQGVPRAWAARSRSQSRPQTHLTLARRWTQPVGKQKGGGGAPPGAPTVVSRPGNGPSPDCGAARSPGALAPFLHATPEENGANFHLTTFVSECYCLFSVWGTVILFQFLGKAIVGNRDNFHNLILHLMFLEQSVNFTYLSTYVYFL